MSTDTQQIERAPLASPDGASADSAPSVNGKIPGEVGVWVFILGDLVIFSLLFGIFLYYRAEDPLLFAAAQENLRQDYALANTLLLLTSSWFVVRGIVAFRSGDTAAHRKFLLLALLCGIGFVALKYLEYSEKFGAGITINTNDFYTYYFVLTGIHLFHLIVGLGVLGFLLQVDTGSEPTEADHRIQESGCLYWHMVDLLWIVILAIVYLI